MQQNDDEHNKKPPIEMTTDEALEYVFGNEIAEELKRQAGRVEPPADCQEDPE
jgi:hypothetical protein